MSLAALSIFAARDENLRLALEQAAQGHRPRIGAVQQAVPYVAGAIATTLDKVLFITASDRSADSLAAALRDFVDPQTVAVFPAWETLPHERLSPSSDTIGARMALLRRLAHPGQSVPVKFVVTPVRAALQPIVRGLGHIEPITVSVGDTFPLDDVIVGLVDLGFERVELVDRRGQFAVRGGIIDVFPPAYEHPVRVEFFGDDIEDIRAFSVSDQRSLGLPSATLEATACKELLITPEVRERARDLAQRHPDLRGMLEKIAEGIAAEGMESLIPALASDRELLIAALGPRWRVIEVEPERIAARAAELVATSAEFLEAAWHNATEGNAVPVDLSDPGYVDYDDFTDGFPANARMLVSTLVGPDDLMPDIGTVPEYRSDIDELCRDIRAWWASGRNVVLAMAGPGSAARIVETLSQRDVAARVVADPAGITAVVEVCVAHQQHGVLTDSLVVVTETDIFAAREASREKRSLPSRRRATIDPLTLSAGDYVVHDQHGVARYVEMQARTVQGATREYMVLEYAPSKRGQRGDRLYVPTHMLDHVTRYVGGEAPKLSRMGGSEWATTKARARKAVRQIAGELIRLYAARMASKGYAFGPDTPWQRELEEAFPYVETPDQLSTIEDVKRDMEGAKPMDRVLVGDVGYGKTEIAVRAAFKAVQSERQVAVLVPTTVLAEQHKRTFTERFADFPVRVGVLSRFAGAKETARVLAELKAGTIDVVIGTHRLLSTDVAFQRLGLIVVDEEHRFGVKHKERLKQLRLETDVLTLTATPIPRTLHLALAGLRDMTLMQTPPRDRSPVLTFVEPWDDGLLEEGITRELDRGGQVFIVHNRIETITAIADHIAKLVPRARVGVGHGQQAERELEKVMAQFVNGEIDVLVSTLIVESGLDVPNANTMFVNRADHLGLAQLYQLRGRVGRSHRRAYCYLMVPDHVDENAERRLKVLEHHTELGAGYRVALKDLEMRGAGNLLGPEQSGFVHAVGFDLYLRLLEDTVKRVMRGDDAPPPQPADVSLDVPAYLPDAYIPSAAAKLDVYRRLTALTDAAAIAEVRAEVRDRFGPLPAEADRYFALAALRQLGGPLGIEGMLVRGEEARVNFRVDALPRLKPLSAAFREVQFQVDVRRVQPLSLKLTRLGGSSILDGLLHALRTITTVER